MIIEESEATPKIKVLIRKRPLSKRELQKADMDIIDIRDPQSIIVRENKTKVDLTKYMEEHNFVFDGAFDQYATNQKIYNDAIRPLVDAAFNKAKVTCFAYGQTGSGKTYTMMGDPGSENKENGGPTPGLYLLAAQDIFSFLEMNEFRHISIWISFYEIYCGKLYDLLNERQQLFAREDAKQNVNIVGLQEKRIMNVHTLMQLIEFGMSVRVTSQNGQNLDSSRSHAVLQINLKDNNKVHGKMSFIDLAGSERAADVTDQNKQTRMDGAEINKSLLALKECIRAIDQDKKHTPFRGSKLTLVLKDSFTGNCRTVMIGNISPACSSCEHTLNTLRYADRVKELKKGSNGPSNEGANSYDILAQQLMLPRQNKNSTKIFYKEENQEDMTQMPPQMSNGSNPLKINNNNMSGNSINNNVNSQPMNNNMNNHYMNYGVNHMNNNNNMMNHINNNNMNVNMNMNVNNNVNYNNQMTYNKARYSMPPNPPNQPIKYPLMPNNQTNNYNPYPNHDLYDNQYAAPPVMQQMNNYKSNNENFVLNGKKIDNNNMNLYQKPAVQPKPGNKPILIPQTYPVQEENLEEMSQKHEQLINIILTDEEEVISMHRKHIDDMVEAIKQEMMLLHEVDKPGSDVDYYVDSLDTLLGNKINLIQAIKNKLKVFKQHLLEEEVLSKKFYEKKNEVMDVFDLKNEHNSLGNDMQLLDNLHEVLN